MKESFEPKINKHKNKKDDDSEESEEDNNDINDNVFERKNKLILKYINGLLKNTDYPPFTDLIEFESIDKDDIVNDDNIKLLEKMSKELFKVFDKSKCRYYPKTAKLQPLNVLRGMINDTGTHILLSDKIENSEIVNNRVVKKSIIKYTIENI